MTSLAHWVFFKQEKIHSTTTANKIIHFPTSNSSKFQTFLSIINLLTGLYSLIERLVTNVLNLNPIQAVPYTSYPWGGLVYRMCLQCIFADWHGLTICHSMRIWIPWKCIYWSTHVCSTCAYHLSDFNETYVLCTGLSYAQVCVEFLPVYIDLQKLNCTSKMLILLHVGVGSIFELVLLFFNVNWFLQGHGPNFVFVPWCRIVVLTISM